MDKYGACRSPGQDTVWNRRCHYGAFRIGCVHLWDLWLLLSIADSVVYVQVELTNDMLGLPYAEVRARIVSIYDIRAVADRHLKQNYASIVCPQRDRDPILDFGLILDDTFQRFIQWRAWCLAAFCRETKRDNIL